MTPKIKANKHPWHNKIEIVIADTQGDRFLAVAKDVLFHKIDPAEIINPTFNLDGQAAQELMDDLWRCGIRPSEGTGSAGQLAATERHLTDMQKLVFNHFVGK